jgi:hypothetical protein
MAKLQPLYLRFPALFVVVLALSIVPHAPWKYEWASRSAWMLWIGLTTVVAAIEAGLIALTIRMGLRARAAVRSGSSRL